MHTKTGFKIDTVTPSGTTSYQNCCVNPQKVHILYNKTHELCTESVFLQELDKMNATINAKYDFNNRDDIVFYVSAEDLIKIQSSKSPVFVRLKPEQPSSKIVTPYIESISKSKDIRPDSPKSDSPKSGRSMRTSSVSLVKPSTPPEYKKILFSENSPAVISYKKNDQEFSIFLIDQKGSDLLCEGLKDSEVEAFHLTGLKCITVKYVSSEGAKPIEASIYTSNINNIRFPIYFLLTTIDYTCKVQNFVEMIEELVNLAKLKELEK